MYTYDDRVFKVTKLLVQYFQPTIQGKHHRLNSAIYSVLIEDVVEKVNRPKAVSKGSHVFYNFE